MIFSPHQKSRGTVDPSKPVRRSGFTLLELFVVIIIILILVAFFLPATRRARPAARRSTCKNNLKVIGLALHNYHDKFGAFPPACTVDAEGQPLHSWRTLLLPYLEQAPLYESIDLSKPWNHPDNSVAYATQITYFDCPSDSIPSNHTTYLGLVTSDSFFRKNESSVLVGSAGQYSQTVMVIEVAPENAVHWMEPIDADRQTGLGFGPKTEFAHSDGTHALFVDGHVQFLSSDLPDEDRRELIENERPATKTAAR